MSTAVANPAIILVDDDPDILRLLQLIINSLATGYTILTCTDADVALEQAMQQPTPLIITDYNLPGMNGLQLTAALKARALFGAPWNRATFFTEATTYIEGTSRE